MKRFLTIGWTVLALAAAFAAGAQERNMARLTLADTAYVDVSMGLRGEAGPMKDIFAPEQLVQGVLDVVSQRRLDKVSLYGRFGYGYDYGKGSTWRGWIDPYETPFMVADSVPGALSLERYSLQAGAGLPLGGGWAAGLDLDYDVALMAKHKDLRSKNTAMTFRIVPGVSWQGESLGLGLDAGYERSTERVEFTQISENVEHTLFDIYGVWLYHGNGYASAETRRFKEAERFFGDFQLDVRLGSAELHNNIRADFRREAQTEVGYNNLRHGDVRSLTWSDDLSLQIGRRHLVQVTAAFSTMQGFRPLQQQELDPDSRIRIWVTYGDPVFCYFRQYHYEKLSYTYGSSWQLTLGVENWKMMHSYTEYPQRFTQRIGTVTPFAALELPVGEAFRLSTRLGFAKDYDACSDVTAWQLAEPMLRQWDYWDGDSVLAGLTLRWSRGRTYVQAAYDLELSTSGTDYDGLRHVAGLTVGFLF